MARSLRFPHGFLSALCCLCVVAASALARAGKTTEAGTYRRLAEGMASQWVESARDGDHYRLAFDKPGTRRASAMRVESPE